MLSYNRQPTRVSSHEQHCWPTQRRRLRQPVSQAYNKALTAVIVFSHFEHATTQTHTHKNNARVRVGKMHNYLFILGANR